jgi:hypothetical protein
MNSHWHYTFESDFRECTTRKSGCKLAILRTFVPIANWILSRESDIALQADPRSEILFVIFIC